MILLPYLFSVPLHVQVEHTFLDIDTHTHMHTPTLVILDQPLCSFSQSSGCPSSPITVATELHPDSLQIGCVTLKTGAPTHPRFTHIHNMYTQYTKGEL